MSHQTREPRLTLHIPHLPLPGPCNAIPCLPSLHSVCSPRIAALPILCPACVCNGRHTNRPPCFLHPIQHRPPFKSSECGRQRTRRHPPQDNPFSTRVPCHIDPRHHPLSHTLSRRSRRR